MRSASRADGTVRDLAQALASIPSPHATPMRHVDTAWLHMDSAVNQMMIVGVWVLQPGITRRALCERLQATLLTYPRFKQCAQEGSNGVHWVPDADFVLDAHVVLEKLPRRTAARQQAALQERIGALAAQPLDRERPLWQFHLVEHYQGGSAMIVRIHHCIADGVALIAVMESLVDGGVLPPQPKRDVPSNFVFDSADAVLESLVFQPLGLATRRVQGLLNFAWRSARSVGHAPGHSLEQGLRHGWDAAKLALHGSRDVAAMAFMPDDSHTRLKGTPSGTKRVAWCAPLDLNQVKAVGKALGCSVNDVLLSCVAGAIAHYLLSCGDDPKGLEIRAMVPVNLRPMNKAYTLGNQFGLAPLLLPIGMHHPLERLQEVGSRMRSLKGSMQPLMTFGLLTLAGYLAKPAQDALLTLFSKKTTAVMTNVIGPAKKLRFLGATVEQSIFWVPQSGSVGLGVSILSYGGSVQFGLIADTALCPNPQAIIDQFAPEFEYLALLAGRTG